MTPAEGAAILIAAAKAEQRQLVMSFGTLAPREEGSMVDAVLVGECALRDAFAGSEMRIRIAAQTVDGTNPEYLFIAANLRGCCGLYYAINWGEDLDLLEASRNDRWPRSLLQSSVYIREAFFSSLEKIVESEIERIDEGLRGT